MISALAVAVLSLCTTLQPVDNTAHVAQAQPAGDRPRPPGGPGGPGGQGERRVSVEGAMKTMNRSLKQLRAQLADASKKDENLNLVNEMQRGCVMAKGAPLPKDVLERAGDAAAQAKMKTTYRNDMIALLRMLIDLEIAVEDGKTDQAKHLLEKIEAERDRAHKEMGVKDED
ncbi:MAG: cytochrome b562 [Phycisphaerales bacterium]